MTLKRPDELWQEYCDVAPGIREGYGVASALSYVVGEKLMMFAQTSEANDGFRAPLPAFCNQIRNLFTQLEVERYFESAERESRIETDLFAGANADEIEDLRARRRVKARSRAPLLGEGHVAADGVLVQPPARPSWIIPILSTIVSKMGNDGSKRADR
jgi:hypothetical protein